MRTWLKQMRTEKNLTQEKIAEKAGIERAYYTMIETGNRNPSVNVAKSIASVLGVNWTIFFENECNKMTQNQKQEVI